MALAIVGWEINKRGSVKTNLKIHENTTHIFLLFTYFLLIYVF